MVSREECIRLIEECNEFHKKSWFDRLAKYGYSVMEEDNTEGEISETPPDNPQLNGFAIGESRIRKKLIFWKEKGLDGLVIGDIEHENEYGKRSYHTKFYTIGAAYDYFNNLYKNIKEPAIRKFFRFGKKKELYGTWNPININGKEYQSRIILDDKKLYKLLEESMKI